MSEIKWHKKVKGSAEQRDMKRRAILDAAAESFVAHGYRGTSLDRLAKSLNVTKAALYYYVNSKEDIFLQCFSISLENVIECAGKAQQEGANGLDKLEIFFRNYAVNAVSHYGASLLLEGERSLTGQNRVAMRTKKREAQDWLIKIIIEGIEDGSIRPSDPKYVSLLLFSAFNLMFQWYRPDGEMSPSDLADELLKPVIQGLRQSQE